MTELFNQDRAYVILRAPDPQTLDDYVNAAITGKGYWPNGGIATNAGGYYQAVVNSRKSKRRRRVYRSERPNPGSITSAYYHLPDDLRESLTLEQFSSVIKFAAQIKSILPQGWQG